MKNRVSRARNTPAPSRWITALLLCAGSSAVDAASEQLAATSLKGLTLEQLLDIEVTSVSRKEESLTRAAAAITVVSNEDIQRSGATSIPEALRFAPGMHVARRNSNSWAVSSRGFSSITSEKLLVLSDTRSIYTPLYSGVFWDVQDYLMQDIERIEVIGGPGAALWGSNAVNGVINISTKRAQDTQGFYSEALVGTEEQEAGVRLGGTAGDVSYRVFGKHFDRDRTARSGATSDDAWRLSHVGFRSDWNTTTADAWTVQGDAYSGTVGQYSPSVVITGRAGPSGDLESKVSGGNLLARWRRTIDASSDVQLRAYYDRTYRNDPSYRDELDTVDLDMQHRFAPTSQQELTWGVNYRLTDNKTIGKGILAMDPRSSKDNLVGAFVQDQISLHDAVRLTLGTKLEYNDFSGFEYQPSVRLAWQVSPRHVLWSAVSRAARVPTRIERDIAVDISSNPASNPIVRLLGNPDFDSEELLAYEVGYRWQALDTLAFDVTAYHHDYEGLASLELGSSFVAPDGRTVFPIINRNLNDARSDGAGLLATFVPQRFWRIIASYSYINIDIEPGGADLNRGQFLEGATPRHQFGVRSLLDIAERWQLDAQWRHHTSITRIPDIVTGEGIDAYSELDVRVAWHTTEQIEMALVGQNLLHSQHLEFGSLQARGEIERSAYVKFSWAF